MEQPATLPVPFVWSAQQPDDERQLLDALDHWVAWLTDRYHLDHRFIPTCWPEHSELLEELSALHLAWQGAYSATAMPEAPLHWHERFANARTRISDWVARTGCRPGAHRA